MSDEPQDAPTGEASAPDAADKGGPRAKAAQTTVNSQILDAVNAINAMAAGQAPAHSAAMLSLAATQASALALHNAVARQQADAVISSAAVVANCARLAGIGAPLPAPVPPPPQVLIAAAEAQIQSGIAILRSQALQSGSDAEAARAALESVVAAASSALSDDAGPDQARQPPASAKRAQPAAPAGKKQ